MKRGLILKFSIIDFGYRLHALKSTPSPTSRLKKLIDSVDSGVDSDFDYASLLKTHLSISIRFLMLFLKSKHRLLSSLILFLHYSITYSAVVIVP